MLPESSQTIWDICNNFNILKLSIIYILIGDNCQFHTRYVFQGQKGEKDKLTISFNLYRKERNCANCSNFLSWGEMKHMSEMRETAHNKQLKFKLSIKNCISIPFKHFQIARPEMHRSASQLSTLSEGWKLNSIIHQHKDEQQIGFFHLLRWSPATFQHFALLFSKPINLGQFTSTSEPWISLSVLLLVLIFLCSLML